MILSIARHGQPAIGDLPPGADHQLPPGDVPLTALGRKQAAYLGEFLKARNFNGTIISSPYARTAETASVVCSVLGKKFYLEPGLQEMRFYPEPPAGMRLEEMRAIYDEVAPDAELTFPWVRQGGAETLFDYKTRFDAFVDQLIEKYKDCDELLCFGHGASLQSMKWNMFQRSNFVGPDQYNWNCSLSDFEILPGGKARIIALGQHHFMPESETTSNLCNYGDPRCIV